MRSSPLASSATVAAPSGLVPTPATSFYQLNQAETQRQASSAAREQAYRKWLTARQARHHFLETAPLLGQAPPTTADGTATSISARGHHPQPIQPGTTHGADWALLGIALSLLAILGWLWRRFRAG